MRTMKVMADYHSFPIWDEAPDGEYNIDPATLPISDDLQKALLDWADEFDAILVLDDPASSSFDTPEAEIEFWDRGRDLADWLQRELGPEFEITAYRPPDILPGRHQAE